MGATQLLTFKFLIYQKIMNDKLEKFLLKVDPVAADKVRRLYEHAETLKDPGELRIATEKVVDEIRRALKDRQRYKAN